MAATIITVTGKFLRADGVTPCVGSISFGLTTPLLDATTNRTYSTSQKTAFLDAMGAMSVQLVASDDPELSPTGGTYLVTARIDGRTSTFQAVVPHNAPGGTVDYAELASSDPLKTYGVSAAQLAAAIAPVSDAVGALQPPTKVVSNGAIASGWTFARGSVRTDPTSGAQLSSGVPLIRKIEEVLATKMSIVTGSSGYSYLGRMPDGNHVFRRQSPFGLVTSPTGRPPFATLVGGGVDAGRITPSGTLLRAGPEPAPIYRRPSPYTAETQVMTMNRGAPVTQGVSGRAVKAATGMCFGQRGRTIILGEYSNTVGVKDGSNPPRWLWRSADDGATWTAIELCSPDPGGAGTHIHSVGYDEVGGAWYASVGDSPAAGVGVYRSTDDGVTWTRIAGPNFAVPGGNQVSVQPVSLMRYGEYVVGGTDEPPTGLWVMDPQSTGVLWRSPFGFLDTEVVPNITWEGVAYYLVEFGGCLIVLPSQGQENYSRSYATRDCIRFWPLAEDNSANGGWSQPILTDDGKLLLKPGTGYVPEWTEIGGIEDVVREVVHTDLAVTPYVRTDAPWVQQTGSVETAAGPGGWDAYKLGKITITVPCVAGDVLTFQCWARNPLGLSVSLILEAWFNVNGPYQKQVTNSLMSPTEWRRFDWQVTAPLGANSVGLSIYMTGASYDATTAYYEVSAPTVTPVADVDGEYRTRAAESLTGTLAVGAGWGVFDRCFPCWDSAVMSGDKTLMQLTDLVSGAVLSVIYVAATQSFKLAQNGQADVAGPAVRCHGLPGNRSHWYPDNQTRAHYGPQDYLAYGVRVHAGAAEMVVWDRANRIVASYAASGSFYPTTLQVQFPASGVAHAPVVAHSYLTGDALYDAMVRGIAT